MPASEGAAPFAVAEAGAGDLDSAWFGQAFAAMYEHFRTCSGRDCLRPDAIDFWKRNYEPMRGKTRLVLIASEGGRPCGFIEGTLRMAPLYLVQDMIGYVSHLYVDAAWRGRGVADLLADALNGWFREKKARRVELHVVEGNEAASRFWRRRGFAFELHQMGMDL